MTFSITTVIADMALAGFDQPVEWRYALALLLVMSYGAASLYKHDAQSFGFVLSPIQGWWYWGRATVLLGLLLLVILIISAGLVLGLLKYSFPPPNIFQPSQIWPLFFQMCILSPVFEEIIYRLAICVPARALFGPTTAIFVSGFAFAALHVVYGCPSPENLFGGFMLSWAFLKSGSIIIPVALHALGNVFAFGFQVAYFSLNI